MGLHFPLGNGTTPGYAILYSFNGSLFSPRKWDHLKWFNSLFHLMGLYFPLENGTTPVYAITIFILMGLYFPQENGTI